MKHSFDIGHYIVRVLISNGAELFSERITNINCVAAFVNTRHISQPSGDCQGQMWIGLVSMPLIAWLAHTIANRIGYWIGVKKEPW